MSLNASKTRSLSWVSSQVVEIEYNDNTTITLENAILDYHLFDKFVKNQRVKKLIISGANTKITEEAKHYISKENQKRANKIIAEAIVVKSNTQKIIANCYFKLIKLYYPTKVFTDKNDALNWLNNLNKGTSLPLISL